MRSAFDHFHMNVPDGNVILEKEHFSGVLRACYFRSLIILLATIISNKMMYAAWLNMIISCVLCVFMPMFNTLAM
jgi:hypothetical protein